MPSADSSKFSLSVSGISGKVTPLAFNLAEGIYSDDLLTVSFQAPSSPPDSLIGKDVSFSFEYEGKKEFFNGIAINCSKEQSEGGTAVATLQAKTLRHKLDKEKKRTVYCKTDVEEIAQSILSKAGISASKISLSKYETDFKVQYDESDLAFLQRLFREHSDEQKSIIEFVQHSGGQSELIISDSGNFPASGSSFVKSRLEATEAGNVFYGSSHAPLRPGVAVDAFGETFIVCAAAHAGNQEAAFGVNGKAHGYTCQIVAFSKQKLSSFVHQVEKPQVPGVIVAKIEGFKDAPAHIDTQGRYIVRMPFDEESENMDSSTPVQLAQNFAGEGYGIHFPLRKDTPVLIAFEDGDIDKPVAMGALPRGLHAGPASRDKAFRNILRTISGMELVLDDDAKSMSVKAPESISAEAGKELSLKTEKLTLEAKKQSVLKTGNGIKISLDDSAGSLKIEAPSDITIKAGGKLILNGTVIKAN
ncbi:MAG: phage baseplate assembly protein V [Fibromonadaceae bacterium]|jgi:uncharacterized protein involved in type VI secretion and phage assembly|nr:phage baseplate assembly protein V [Fibromonadaceae bacterium]